MTSNRLDEIEKGVFIGEMRLVHFLLSKSTGETCL